MTRTLVCVVGSDGKTDVDHARELGRRIAAAGWVVVTGGRAAGVMEAASAGAKEIDGSITVGILPSSNTTPSRHVDIPIVTDMHNARNNINVLTGRVTVACGATGAGTASEIALAIKNKRPVILLGCSDEAVRYFTSLGSVHVAATVDEAMQRLKEWIR